MESLAEHVVPITTGLLILVNVLVGVIWGSLVSTIKKVENKVDEFIKLHYECQKKLPELYVRAVEFQKWSTELHNDRKERWDQLKTDLADQRTQAEGYNKKLDEILARLEYKIDNHIGNSHTHMFQGKT